jgi:site-specific recombinase XerD
MKQKETRESIATLKEKLKQKLIAYRYSEMSIGNYMRIFGWLEKFLSERGETEYSPQLGHYFLAEYRLQPQHNPVYYGRARVLVRRLDETIGNKVFVLQLSLPKAEVPLQFKEWHEKYCDYLRRVGLSESTITSHSRYARRFLIELSKKVHSYGELTAADLYDYFVNNDRMPCHSPCVVKRFLSFLFKNSVIKSDLSVCVPQLRRPQPLPSVYTGDEINKLLATVNRNDSIGKRDYAIIMLASRLGLRSSDIVNLTEGNIDLCEKTISIVQVKTSVPQKLVMNDEVEGALFDYINNGRPQTENAQLFLHGKAPFLPIKAATCFAIVKKYFDLAGIAAQGRRQGPHALRASYASALVAKGVPYSVVQKALGHEDIESSKHYVRTDANRLRNCALDVPKPTGAFAALIGDLEVVTL